MFLLRLAGHQLLAAPRRGTPQRAADLSTQRPLLPPHPTTSTPHTARTFPTPPGYPSGTAQQAPRPKPGHLEHDLGGVQDGVPEAQLEQLQGAQLPVAVVALLGQQPVGQQGPAQWEGWWVRCWGQGGKGPDWIRCGWLPSPCGSCPSSGSPACSPSPATTGPTAPVECTPLECRTKHTAPSHHTNAPTHRYSVTRRSFDPQMPTSCDTASLPVTRSTASTARQ